MNKFMSSLLSDEDMVKLSYTKVSPRAADWPKDVLDTLYAEFPTLMPYNASVSFREKDESRGYGVGAIHVAGMAVPAIIKDYKLAPLDVALIQGTTIPLTKESVAALASQKNAFAQLEPLDADRLLTTFDPALQSAAGAPIVNASPQGYEKSASILDKLSGYITKEAKARVVEMTKYSDMRKLAKDNERLTAAFDKVARMKTVDRVESVEEALNRKITRDIHYLYKTAQYRYTGIFGNSQIDSAAVIDNLEASSIQGIPAVKTSPGEHIEKQADLDTGETDVGVAPSAGDYGILKYSDGEATLPFMVGNVTATNRSFVINGHDGFEPRNFYPIRGITEPMDHEVDKYGSYVPLTARFVRMDVDDQNSVKHASFADFRNKVTCLDELSYRIEGPQLTKYAARHESDQGWRKHDAIWAVIATGGSTGDVEKIAELKPGKTYEIETRLRLPVPINKLAELVQDEILKYSDSLDTVKPALMKLAAYMPTGDSVDAVIGLNFLSKVNLQEFVEMIPLYEHVTSTLARLLIAIRMGLEKMPEEPVRTGMKELMKVVYFLRGIKNLQKS
jgi:hypothetical protein